MAKKISNRGNASVTLQSVAEESNLGYKPLLQDENESPVSHHRKRLEKISCEKSRSVGPENSSSPSASRVSNEH